MNKSRPEPKTSAILRLSIVAFAILYAVALAALLLYPFRWQKTLSFNNSAKWEDNRIVFSAPGLLSSAGYAETIVKRIAASGFFSIDMIVTSFSNYQSGGPSPIISLTDSAGDLFVIGQNDGHLVVSIKTSRKPAQDHLDLSAASERRPAVDILAPYRDPRRKYLGREPNRGTPLILIRDTFEPRKPTHIRLTYDGRFVQIHIGGKLAFAAAMPDADFGDSWSPQSLLLLGNALANDRAWLGEISALSLSTARDDAGTDNRAAYAEHTPSLELMKENETLGMWQIGVDTDRILLELVRPTARAYSTKPYPQISKEWESIRRKRILTSEDIGNILVFLPIGIMLSWLVSRKISSGAVQCLVVPSLGLFISAFIETNQFFIATRTPSAIDISTNTIGAFAGWLSYRLRHGTGRADNRGRGDNCG